MSNPTTNPHTPNPKQTSNLNTQSKLVSDVEFSFNNTKPTTTMESSEQIKDKDIMDALSNNNVEEREEE